MKVAVAALLCLVAPAVLAQMLTPDSVMDARFEAYKVAFNKLYDSNDAESYARKAYEVNARLAELENAADPNAEYGDTIFSDMMPEDFAEQYLRGVDPFPNVSPFGREAEWIDEPASGSYDWRQHGAVTSVKNQGSCGSCWSFATTAAIESAQAVGGRSITSLSEQQMVDCSRSDSGCNGGWLDTAFEYIIKAGGQEKDSDYPYHARQSSCHFDKSKVAATISSWHKVSSDEGQMAATCEKHGVLAVAVDATPMMRYQRGIISGSCSHNVNHGVAVVGFGSDSGVDYWIIKNSWGTHWGESGYCRLRRGTGQCAVNLHAEYVSV